MALRKLQHNRITGLLSACMCVCVCVAGWVGVGWAGGGSHLPQLSRSDGGEEKKKKAWKCQGASTLLIVMRLTVSLHPLCPQSILPGCPQTESSSGGVTRRGEHSELRGFVRWHKNAANAARKTLSAVAIQIFTHLINVRLPASPSERSRQTSK